MNQEHSIMCDLGIVAKSSGVAFHSCFIGLDSCAKVIKLKDLMEAYALFYYISK